MKLADLIVKAFMEEREERVGRAPMELVKELEQIEEERRKAHEELERKVKEIAWKLKEQHEPIFKELDKRRAETWEKIYDSVGIPEKDREHEYNVDRLTGVVSRVTRKLPQNVEQSLEKALNEIQNKQNKWGVH
jgi:phage-related protein